MEASALTLDFFHDVVCGWCFNISPRLRALADTLNLQVRHRAFVLQDSPERMAEVFGSPRQAKAAILSHWASCQRASDTPEKFNIDGMRAASFDYPHGLPGALACKAAERIGGQAAHWDMFDAVQRAHLSEARNVADTGVLTAIAAGLGFRRRDFGRVMAEPATQHAVEQDRRLAGRLQVVKVPTIIVRQTGARLVNGPLEDLRAQIQVSLQLQACARAGGAAGGRRS